MKRRILSLGLCLLSLTMFGQADLPISEIKLFTMNGLVTHDGEITLKKGLNKIEVNGITSSIDANRVIYTQLNTYRVFSATLEYDNDGYRSTSYKKQEQRIKTYINDNELIAIDIIEQERTLELLRKNDKLTDVDATTLNEMITYQKQQTVEANKKLRNLKKQTKSNMDSIRAIKARLSNARWKHAKTNAKFIFEIEAPEPGTFPFSFSYLSRDCGWAASYDVASKNDDIVLDYNAKGYNGTGVDWKNVTLTMSTGNPYEDTQLPELMPWIISNNTRTKSSPNLYKEKSESLYEEDEIVMANSAVAPGSYTYAQPPNQQATMSIEVDQAIVEFEIIGTRNLPSNGKPYSFAIKSQNFTATFKYRSVPSVRSDAFYSGAIGGWQSMRLIPGKMKVYNQGSYVGESFFNPYQFDDSLFLDFGVDKRVIIKRERVENESNTTVLAGNKKQNHSFLTSIKNTSSDTVSITVYDQIPVSKVQDVSVTLKEMGTGVLDEATGIITWELKVLPGETTVITFKYFVKSPKGRKINGKKASFRRIECPSF